MSNNRFKIAHLTSVHTRLDTRIFFKICHSLANQNYNVFYIVADGKGDQLKNNISIIDVGIKKPGRFSRMTYTVSRIFRKALELDCELYHLHDPELIPVGLKLKKHGKKVIFDVHENTSLQILDKSYIPFFLRKIISILFKYYEIISLKNFDALVLAETSYLKDYVNLNSKTEVILNLPDLKLLKKFQKIKRDKIEIYYIGRISNSRGYDVIINAMKILKKKLPNILLHFVGPYDQKHINSIDLRDINQNIKFHGPKSLPDGLEYSKNAKIGICILKPLRNYINSYSTKIFEYMAIGLPVITSNFKIYTEIIEKYQCGICVNPNKPDEIAKAIERIINNPNESKQMGLNGIKAVEQKFNWEIEKKKLYKLYETVII